MNFLDLFNIFKRPVKHSVPSDFRRNARKYRVVGYVQDSNSKHPGFGFQGKITPMRRHFRFSKTAK
jgi:hypothetical protein